jgi:hypothetical protein
MDRVRSPTDRGSSTEVPRSLDGRPRILQGGTASVRWMTGDHPRRYRGHSTGGCGSSMDGPRSLDGWTAVPRWMDRGPSMDGPRSLDGWPQFLDGWTAVPRPPGAFHPPPDALPRPRGALARRPDAPAPRRGAPPSRAGRPVSARKHWRPEKAPTAKWLRSTSSIPARLPLPPPARSAKAGRSLSSRPEGGPRAPPRKLAKRAPRGRRAWWAPPGGWKGISRPSRGARYSRTSTYTLRRSSSSHSFRPRSSPSSSARCIISFFTFS